MRRGKKERNPKTKQKKKKIHAVCLFLPENPKLKSIVQYEKWEIVRGKSGYVRENTVTGYIRKRCLRAWFVCLFVCEDFEFKRDLEIKGRGRTMRVFVPCVCRGPIQWALVVCVAGEGDAFCQQLRVAGQSGYHGQTHCTYRGLCFPSGYNKRLIILFLWLFEWRRRLRGRVVSTVIFLSVANSGVRLTREAWGKAPRLCFVLWRAVFN